jgi:subtilisin family serine protease
LWTATRSRPARSSFDSRNPDLARLRGDVDTETDRFVDGRVWHARSPARNVQTLIRQLAARPDVLYAEPNYLLYTTLQPNDPLFPNLWNLLNVGQTVGGTPGTPGADIHATDAWDTAIGARTVLVGVVDTGVDYSHPDLAANVWSAPAQFTITVGGLSITCPAGTHGFNAITKKCDPFDDHFHGTHVPGTIGAVGNNGLGVVGVNSLANIIGLKFLDASGAGTAANAINAIEFGIQAKATLGAVANIRVLSNSWGGGGFSQALLDEITRANQNDMLFVAAAGNSSSNNDLTPSYPATYAVPNVVAVAATDNQDGLASFSNYGPATVLSARPASRSVDGTVVRLVQRDVDGHTACVRRGCTVAHALFAHYASAEDAHPQQCRSDPVAGWSDNYRWTSEPGACGRRLRTCRQRRTHRHTNGAGDGYDDFCARTTDIGRERVRCRRKCGAGRVLRRNLVDRQPNGAAVPDELDERSRR